MDVQYIYIYPPNSEIIHASSPLDILNSKCHYRREHHFWNTCQKLDPDVLNR